MCIRDSIDTEGAARQLGKPRGRYVTIDLSPLQKNADDVLERASLLPPQICELSQRLAPVYPQLAHIYEVDAMADAVVALKEEQ